MAIETKLTQKQYQALLSRTMTKTAPQQSQLMQMQGEMDGASMLGMQDEMQTGMMQGINPNPSVMMPTTQMPPTETTPEPEGMGFMPPQQASNPMVDTIQQAVSVWQQLANGVGGQLWARIVASSPELAGRKPADAFISSMVKFNRDPNAIVDPNVREFLKSVVGEPTQGQQPIGLKSIAPQIAQAMTRAQRPGGM